MHAVLAGFLMAWREKTPYAKDDDYVLPSIRLKGKKPLSASIMVQKYLRLAAVKAGVIKQDQQVRFGFHNFRHPLASSLVKLKCHPKTVQGILRHEDVRTTMQLYAQSDPRIEARSSGQVLGAAARRQGPPAHGDDPVTYLGLNLGLEKVCFGIMAARDGIEPPTPPFSGLNCRVFTMTWNARTTL
jgi:Phage integrase family